MDFVSIGQVGGNYIPSRSAGWSSRMTRVLIAAVVFAALASAQVSPVVWLELEFDVPGTLPSASGLWGLYNATMLPETAIFSVSGGSLNQSLLAAAAGAFYYAGDSGQPLTSLTPYAIAFNSDMVVEARLRVIAGAGRHVFVEAQDGLASYGFAIDSTLSAFTLPLAPNGSTLIYPWPSGYSPTAWHTYRFESDASVSNMRLYVDDVLVGPAVTVGATAGGSGIRFGNALGLGAADAEWDYVRIFNGPGLFANPIAVGGSLQIGNTLYLSVFSAQTPNAPFGIGFSLSTSPGITLPDGRAVMLTPDSLFWAALMPNSGVFSNVTGALGPTGVSLMATSVAIPNDPALIGLTVYAAAVMGDPNLPAGVGRIGSPLSLTVLP